MNFTHRIPALILGLLITSLSISAYAQGKGKGAGAGGPGSQNDCTDCSDNADDTYFGTEADENIDGLGGNDFLNGGLGLDQIQGSEGDDVLWAYIDPSYRPVPLTDDSGGGLSGGPDNDTLHGDEGSNGMSGGDGDDTVYGYGGDDEIWPFPGHDTIDGGDGRDTIRVNTDQMQFLVNLKGAVGYVDGKPIPDTAETVSITIPRETPAGVVDVVYDVPGLTVLDVLNADSQSPYSDANTAFAVVANMEGMRLGTANDDYVCGSDTLGAESWVRGPNSGNGEWWGMGRGDDYISAGDGDDFIGADRGDDILIGGRGSDLLHGSENADTHVFYDLDFTGVENDVIDDFNTASDKVVLVGLYVHTVTDRADDDGGNDGKGKPDWVVTLRRDADDMLAGKITFWDVEPDPTSSYFVDGDAVGWPADFCRPPPP